MPRTLRILQTAGLALALIVILAVGSMTTAAVANKGGHSGSNEVKTGHYAGGDGEGHTLSFDVKRKNGRLAITNFNINVVVECWGGEPASLVARIRGFGSPVSANGLFEIFYSPDDDTEFSFDGRIEKDRGGVEVVAGGTFDVDGTPSPTGAYQCDSWGERYSFKHK